MHRIEGSRDIPELKALERKKKPIMNNASIFVVIVMYSSRNSSRPVVQRSKLRGTHYDTLHSLYEIGGPFFCTVYFGLLILNALKICNQNAGCARRSGSKVRKSKSTI